MFWLDRGLLVSQEWLCCVKLVNDALSTTCYVCSIDVILGGLVVIMLVIEPKFRGFIPGRGWWFLGPIKIRGSICFRGWQEQSNPRRKILWHIKDPAEYNRNTSLAKFKDISRQLPASVSYVYFNHWAAAGESSRREQSQAFSRFAKTLYLYISPSRKFT
jgi:hypothetical protein